MKILILRFSSIGDIVLTTPVVRCLRKRYPDAKIHYCTKKKFAAILEPNPHIDKIITLDERLRDVVSQLRREKYDYVIDLHNNLRTMLIKCMLLKPSYTFRKLNLQKWLLVNFKINLLPNIHVVDRYMETVKKLGVENDGMGLDYFVPSEDIVDVQNLPEPYRNGYAAMAIGAQHLTKKLPVHRIIDVCKLSPFPVILLGGKEDFAQGEEVAAQFKNSDKNVLNACGAYSLHQSASLVQQSKLVFTNDTGLMHIAAAFKKEIYSFWGNTVPAFGMYPYKTHFHIIENKNLSCRPCSKIGYKRCPKKHFKCMNELDVTAALSRLTPYESLGKDSV